MCQTKMLEMCLSCGEKMTQEEAEEHLEGDDCPSIGTVKVGP
jgi:predicted RNA-binding Zn-ribbon protein involved in translation (DUF1610 family)